MKMYDSEIERSMKEFDLAWKEFYKGKPKPKTDEEDRKLDVEFHEWYNNIRKQSDTGKTPAEMGERMLELCFDDEPPQSEQKKSIGRKIL